MDETEIDRVSPGFLELVEGPLDLFGEPIDRRIGENSLGHSSGTPDGRFCAASDDDRDGNMRRRPHSEFGQVVDGPRVLERLAGPGVGEDLEDLLHGSPPQMEVGAERLELDGVPSEA